MNVLKKSHWRRDKLRGVKVREQLLSTYARKHMQMGVATLNFDFQSPTKM